MNDVFLSCDWGTSTLRLRLVKANSGNLLGEVITRNGVAGIFDQWIRLKEKPDRLTYFQENLINAITELEIQYGASCRNLKLVVSGMASSSIGMMELPYARLPLVLNEEAFPINFIQAEEKFPHDTLLISGLRTQNDVMRGEETELIGLIKGMRRNFGEGVFIFPGTHSKHIKVKNDEITDFQTLMTGELFEILTAHSTLSASLKKPQDFDTSCQDAFVEGIKASGQQSFLAALFKTRTNQLFNKLDTYQNFYYLSGLIIGTELSVAKNYDAIVLCAGQKFLGPYQLGIQELGLSAKCEFVPSSDVALLASHGHRIIFQNWNLKHRT